mmetsp:Transcript_20627/g.44901  ORF Transcript_20627/g.44901 Transcript_20627/m.44901 type:complete len:215 (-) Transcript_20627:392-1036(-)
MLLLLLLLLPLLVQQQHEPLTISFRLPFLFEEGISAWTRTEIFIRWNARNHDEITASTIASTIASTSTPALLLLLLLLRPLLLPVLPKFSEEEAAPNRTNASEIFASIGKAISILVVALLLVPLVVCEGETCRWTRKEIFTLHDNCNSNDSSHSSSNLPPRTTTRLRLAAAEDKAAAAATTRHWMPPRFFSPGTRSNTNTTLHHHSSPRCYYIT